MNPKAFCISLRNSNGRWEKQLDHLSERGIEVERFYGIDANIAGLETRYLYEVDHPGTGFKIGSKLVCLYLSHYMLWRALEHRPENDWWILEDDSQWDEDWAVRYQEAMAIIPKDWDLIWLGSCCAQGKGQQVGKNVWLDAKPMCTHAYAVRRSALTVLSETLEKVYAPVDIGIQLHAMSKLKTYTILPRLCGQFNTLIPP